MSFAAYCYVRVTRIHSRVESDIPVDDVPSLMIDSLLIDADVLVRRARKKLTPNQTKELRTGTLGWLAAVAQASHFSER